MACLNKNKGVY